MNGRLVQLKLKHSKKLKLNKACNKVDFVAGVLMFLVSDATKSSFMLSKTTHLIAYMLGIS